MWRATTARWSADSSPNADRRALHSGSCSLDVSEELDPRDAGPRAEEASEPRGPGAADPTRLADDDPIEPGPKAPVFSETRPPAPCLLERYLDRIGGVRPIAADQASQTNESVVVLDDERVEGHVGQDARVSVRQVDVQGAGRLFVGHLNRYRTSWTPKRVNVRSRLARPISAGSTPWHHQPTV